MHAACAGWSSKVDRCERMICLGDWYYRLDAGEVDRIWSFVRAREARHKRNQVADKKILDGLRIKWVGHAGEYVFANSLGLPFELKLGVDGGVDVRYRGDAVDVKTMMDPRRRYLIVPQYQQRKHPNTRLYALAASDGHDGIHLYGAAKRATIEEAPMINHLPVPAPGIDRDYLDYTMDDLADGLG